MMQHLTTLGVNTFPDAVQVPLRKEHQFRRSLRATGLFCLVLEHAAGGCNTQTPEGESSKLVERNQRAELKLVYAHATHIVGFN